MEETQTPLPVAQPIVQTAAPEKRTNMLVLAVFAALGIIFSLLVYGLIKDQEVSDVMHQNMSLSNLKIMPKLAKPTPVPQQVVEGTDSVEVGSIDSDLQDLNSNLQGL